MLFNGIGFAVVVLFKLAGIMLPPFLGFILKGCIWLLTFSFCTVIPAAATALTAGYAVAAAYFSARKKATLKEGTTADSNPEALTTFTKPASNEFNGPPDNFDWLVTLKQAYDARVEAKAAAQVAAQGND